MHLIYVFISKVKSSQNVQWHSNQKSVLVLGLQCQTAIHGNSLPNEITWLKQLNSHVSRFSTQTALEERLTQVSKEATEHAGRIQLDWCHLSNCLNLEVVVQQLLLNAAVFRQNHHYSVQSTAQHSQVHPYNTSQFTFNWPSFLQLLQTRQDPTTMFGDMYVENTSHDT